MKNILIFLFVIAAFKINAQENCKCCTEDQKLFNFWEGDWEVFDSTGNKVGENLIIKMQDGCVLQENWKSKSSTGTSYNYFNSADSSWNQVWIDNQGGNLVLKGGIIDGKMVMKSELVPGQNVDFYYNQISWTPNKDESVTQTWNIYDKKGEYLTSLFKGIYKLKRK